MTEAFAWLLESDSDFQDAFLELVNEVLDQNGVPVPIDRGDSVSWETQESFEDCRFDLVARLPESLLIFEHKVWAGATGSQIDKYRDAAVRLAPARTARVLMITANALQHQDADACLCWKDVYSLIDRYRERYAGSFESDRYLQDFQDLLLHEGLGPPAPVSHQALALFPITRHLPRRLQQLFGALSNRDWSFFEGYQFSAHENRVGRIGLAFKNISTNAWAPGFLIVCVLDGSDLGIDERLEDRLKLHVIPSFNRSLHSVYPAFEGYRRFKDDFREVAAMTSWSFFDSLEHQSKPNRYHPLHLEYPLIDLLRGTEEMDDQVSQVYSAVAELLKALLAKDGLTALEQDCRAKLDKDGMV